MFASAGKILLRSIELQIQSAVCGGSFRLLCFHPPQLSALLNYLTVTVKYVWANRATWSRKRGLDSSNTCLALSYNNPQIQSGAFSAKFPLSQAPKQGQIHKSTMAETCNQITFGCVFHVKQQGGRNDLYICMDWCRVVLESPFSFYNSLFTFISLLYFACCITWCTGNC